MAANKHRGRHVRPAMMANFVAAAEDALAHLRIGLEGVAGYVPARRQPVLLQQFQYARNSYPGAELAA